MNTKRDTKGESAKIGVFTIDVPRSKLHIQGVHVIPLNIVMENLLYEDHSIMTWPHRENASLVIFQVLNHMIIAGSHLKRIGRIRH